MKMLLSLIPRLQTSLMIAEAMRIPNASFRGEKHDTHILRIWPTLNISFALRKGMGKQPLSMIVVLKRE